MSQPIRWKRYGKYVLEWDTYIPDHIASATIRYTGTKGDGQYPPDSTQWTADTTWSAKAK